MKSTAKKNIAQLNNELSTEEIIEIGKKAYEESIAITWRQVEAGRLFTQNEKIALIDEKTLVIGADIGSEKHDIRAFDYRGREFSKKAYEFANNEEGFAAAKAWILEIRDKQQMEKIFVGMEPTGHYWINFASWLMNEGITVVTVNPHHVKKSKELDDNLNRKTDHKDPKVIAGLVHEGRYSMPYLPVGLYASLRNLNNLRMMNTEEKTRCLNRLNRWLSIYFPEYHTVFKDVSGEGSMLLLAKAAIPEDIIKLGADAINQIWRSAKLRGNGYAKALKIVSAARCSVGQKQGLDIARDEVLWIIEDLQKYMRWEEDLINRIDAMAAQIPYIENVLAIKGLGLRTVTGILAEIGDISRFSGAKQVQKLAGLALVEDSSGKHEGKTIISKRGRKRLRYHLYQASLALISQNDEFREIYDYYRSREGKALKKMQALMAVACKLLRVLYAMITKGVKYDPGKMLRDIRRPTKEAA